MTARNQSNPEMHSAPEHVALPAPTAWPAILALGLTLMAAGLLSSNIVSLFGIAISIVAGIGWARQVLPHDRHEMASVSATPVQIAASHRKVSRMAAAEATPHRARLPLEIYPISAGIKGGLAGGVAMAVLAMFYGIVSHGSIWYPINLLGAIVYEHIDISTAQVEAFHIELLLVATVLHLATSVLVGLLYGAILPMLARRPILLGGVFAPLVWTGLLHSILDIVDPILNQRIDWWWFLASQIGFGIVAGLVVVRQVRIPTWQYPLAARAGVETPGMISEENPRS